jgi:hypothetical protein
LEAHGRVERLLVLAEQLAHDVEVVCRRGLANRDVVYRDCSTR